jgi:hypothetical protein
VRARNQCRTGRADRNNERSNAPAGDRSEIFASFRGGFEVLDETNDRAIDFASSRSIPRDERNPTLTAMATSMFIQFTKVEVLFLATSVAHRKRSAIPRPLPRAHPHVTMSFAVSASATRVVASARAPVKARNTTVAAFAAPVASKASAAKLAARHATAGVALRATGASTVARAGRNMRVLAGRFEAERTYIMIKPDGVQRGYVRSHAPLLRDRDGYLLPRRLRARASRHRTFGARRGENARGAFFPTPSCVFLCDGRRARVFFVFTRRATKAFSLTAVTHYSPHILANDLHDRLATSCPASRRRASC